MKLTPSLFVVVLLSGCVNTSQVDNDIRNAAVPQNWQVSEKTMPATDNWFAQFSQPKLSLLVNEALNNNQSLRQKAYDVQILEQQLVQADADFWPDLDLGLNTGSSKSTSGSVSNSSSIELEGKL